MNKFKTWYIMNFFFMVDGFCFRFFKIISSKSNKSWPFVLNKTTLITIQKLIIYISRKKINRLFLSPLSKIFFYDYTDLNPI